MSAKDIIKTVKYFKSDITIQKGKAIATAIDRTTPIKTKIILDALGG